MNKKYIFAIFVISLLILITACEEGGEDITGIPEPFEGGSQGLIAEFEEIGIIEEGEYTFYEDELIPMQINFKNKGEEDIEVGDLRIELKGILIQDFSGIVSDTLTNTELIEGVSEFNPEGGEEIIDFTPTGGASYLQEIAGTHYTINPFIVYTYEYSTKALVPEVCFKEDLRDTRLCNVKESKQIFSSGAPIQVISVEEETAGTGKISLIFEVENVGGGEVTTPGDEFNPSYGQIAYRLEPITERPNWECTAAGRQNEARLIGGTTVIRCRLLNPLPEDALYTKAIGLVINYDYRDVIQQKIRIKKAI
ncbi:hypothetical protein KY343_03470 [Candidatus Woesearchaeota archaeon]|nr:hypothetical protein [Candidatus Woesearchaeota archaeon]